MRTTSISYARRTLHNTRQPLGSWIRALQKHNRLSGHRAVIFVCTKVRKVFCVAAASHGPRADHLLYIYSRTYNLIASGSECLGCSIDEMLWWKELNARAHTQTQRQQTGFAPFVARRRESREEPIRTQNEYLAIYVYYI